jgi:hypothetical protein
MKPGSGQVKVDRFSSIKDETNTYFHSLRHFIFPVIVEKQTLSCRARLSIVTFSNGPDSGKPTNLSFTTKLKGFLDTNHPET